jgi:hypothetical protein
MYIHAVYLYEITFEESADTFAKLLRSDKKTRGGQVCIPCGSDMYHNVHWGSYSTHGSET